MTTLSFPAPTALALPSLSLFINPPLLYDPRTNGYSHVAVVMSPARFIYVAGQGGEDASGVLSPDFAVQVDQALHNLRTALDAAGASVIDVVKLVILIVEHSEQRLAVLRLALSTIWGDNPLPACTLIPVPRLALDRMLFEIEATAVTALLTAASED